MQSEKLTELLHQYFELGVAEGREGRNHDTEAGDAQRVLSEIEAEISALSTDAEPVATVAEMGVGGMRVLMPHPPGSTQHLRIGTKLYAEPVKTAPAVAVKATPEALEQFTAYFVKNYPGPDTIIFDPKWHAPKIFRAAISALSAQVQDVAETLEVYYKRQIQWSRETFGPSLRTKGIIDHITKELREIEADPHDLSEWVDVVILAMDGFWRHGGNAEDLFKALVAKQRKNMARTWPDWRTMSEDSAIEHDRSKDAASPASKHGDAE